jgi:hypothetical protein
MTGQNIRHPPISLFAAFLKTRNSIPARSLLVRHPIGISTLFELRNMFVEDRSINAENTKLGCLP